MEKEKDKADIISSIIFTLMIGTIPIITFVISWIIGIDVGYFGIIPRNIDGIRGIITGPLVHGSLNHLFSNLPPLLFSIFLIRYFYKKQFALIFIANYLLTGVMVWCFARDVSHIGISGVVYALISFIFWTGIFVRNKTSIILALLVLMVYSGMFSGILPLPEMIEKNISWESHLLGGLVGILVAWWQKDTIKETLSIQSPPRIYTTEEPRQPYLPPDTFDKTKWERYLDEQKSKFDPFQ